MMNAVPMTDNTEPSRSVTSIAYNCVSVMPIFAVVTQSDATCCCWNLYMLDWNSATKTARSDARIPGASMWWHGPWGRCRIDDLGERGQNMHENTQLQFFSHTVVRLTVGLNAY